MIGKKIFYFMILFSCMASVCAMTLDDQASYYEACKEKFGDPLKCLEIETVAKNYNDTVTIINSDEVLEAYSDILNRLNELDNLTKYCIELREVSVSQSTETEKNYNNKENPLLFLIKMIISFLKGIFS